MMTRHVVYIDGEKTIVEREDEPPTQLTPEEIDAIVEAAAEKRLTGIMELAEALGLDPNPAQIRANLVAIERRKQP